METSIDCCVFNKCWTLLRIRTHWRLFEMEKRQRKAMDKNQAGNEFIRTDSKFYGGPLFRGVRAYSERNERNKGENRQGNPHKTNKTISLSMSFCGRYKMRF